MENKTKKNDYGGFFNNDFVSNPDKYDNSKPPKVSDFTSDGAVMNEAMLRELSHAWHQFMTLKDPQKEKRAQRLYHELLSYLSNELTKKGKKSDFTSEEEKTIQKWIKEEGMSRDEAEELLALSQFGKGQPGLKGVSKGKSDFTDDANFPVTNKLYSLMTQILNILDRQMNRLEKEISKMNDRERDRLYDHPFIKEFRIDLLP